MIRTALIAFALVLVLAAPAAAQTQCSSLPNPIYVSGSSVLRGLVGKPGLVGNSTVVSITPGACVGLDQLINGTKATGNATYYDASGTLQNCTLDPAGASPSLVVSDVPVSLCTGLTLPANMRAIPVAVDAAVLVTHKNSSQASISAGAAYMVFGVGGQITPWTDPAQLQVRTPTSSTQLVWGSLINVPANKWKGVAQTGSGGVITAIASSTVPDASLGIVLSDSYDTSRNSVKALAYQHFAQRCGFLPDSTATSLDKLNVRQGRYAAWTYVTLVGPIDGSGNLVSPVAAQILDVSTTGPIVDAHVTPMCAMEVQRTTPTGPLTPFAPAAPCGCFFQSRVGMPLSQCKACTVDADCAPGHCRLGYCEAR
jgi:hypothetical protein